MELFLRVQDIGVLAFQGIVVVKQRLRHLNAEGNDPNRSSSQGQWVGHGVNIAFDA